MGKGGMASMGLERRVGKHRHRPVAQCAALVVALALLLVAPSVAAATVLPSTIKENTTLAPAGNPYTGTSTIESGVTLTVQPDVKFKANAIIVKGTLKAEGTAEEPIVFTGDEEKAWGEWQNIKFEPGSGKSVLDHVEVKYGGFISGSGGVEISAASPTITNSVFYKNKGYGILSPDGGSPEIAANSFSANGGSSAIRYAAGNGESGEINIHDNDVEYGNGGIYVGINGTGSAVGTDLSGNTIVGTSGTGITYSGPDIPTNITENTLIANSNNGIYVDGTVAHSSTWKDAGTLMHLSSDLTIAAGVTLSIQPGVVLLPKAIIVKGTLKAEGTAEEPIVFTGDEEKAWGEWQNIKFEPGSGKSVLDHVEVKYGGFISGSGGVEISAASPTITNSVFYKNKGYGILSPDGGSPEIAANSFSANGGSSAIRYAAGNGESGEINIHDNDVEYGNGGIYVGINGTGSAVGTDLSGNTIVGTSGTGLTYSGPDIPTNITENTLIANSNNGIYVDGTVAHSSTWKDAGTLMHLSSDLTIAAGVTLSIQPGVVLLPKAIIVKGTLKAEGTAEEPIVFTGDEEKTTGEWKNIKFESGSGASVLNYVEVKFGGSPSNSGAIESNGPSIVVTNSTLSRNQYYAIKVLTGSPKIEWNRFRGGANGLTFNGTGTLAAPNNDWGCASGPKPAGCGSSVNSKVDWKPAVQLPEPAAHCRGKGSQCGEGADPVSLATGQLSYSHRDLLLTNKGKAPLELTRAYSSGSAVDTGFGPGWSQAGLANATELASGDVLIQRQDGRQDLFDKAEAGFTAPSGVTDTLAKVEGTFRLTTLQGTVSAFDFERPDRLDHR